MPNFFDTAEDHTYASQTVFSNVLHRAIQLVIGAPFAGDEQLHLSAQNMGVKVGIESHDENVFIRVDHHGWKQALAAALAAD